MLNFYCHWRISKEIWHSFEQTLCSDIQNRQFQGTDNLLYFLSLLAQLVYENAVEFYLLKALTCFWVVFFSLSHHVWDCNLGTRGWSFLRGDPDYPLHRRGCQVLQEEKARDRPGAEVAGPRVARPDCVVRARKRDLLRPFWALGPPPSAGERPHNAGHLFLRIFSWKGNFDFIDMQYYRFYEPPLFVKIFSFFVVCFFF